jgi:hypothetical protein
MKNPARKVAAALKHKRAMFCSDCHNFIGYTKLTTTMYPAKCKECDPERLWWRGNIEPLSTSN